MAFDERAAWTGTYSDRIPEQIRIEAASWHGRPVSWSITGAWDSAEPAGAAVISWIVPAASAFVLVATLAGAALAARSNLRAGRGDRKGAARVAGVFFLLMFCAWSVTASHTPSFWEVNLIMMALALFGFGAAVNWLAYVAIEPYIRRHWPDALISWNRLQAGHYRDALVASHLLVGLAARHLMVFVVAMLLGPPPGVGGFGGSYLDSPRDAMAYLIGAPAVALVFSMAFLMLVVVSRMLLPKVWIADVVASLLMGIAGVSPGSTAFRMLIASVVNAIFIYVAFWVFRRYGFLATVAWWLGYATWGLAPLVLTEWYAGMALAAHGLPVALAALALWVIVSSERKPAHVPL
jgi:MFS family permease